MKEETADETSRRLTIAQKNYLYVLAESGPIPALTRKPLQKLDVLRLAVYHMHRWEITPRGKLVHACLLLKDDCYLSTRAKYMAQEFKVK